MAKKSNGEGTIRERRPGQFMGQIMLGYKADGKPNRVTVYGNTKTEVKNKLRQLSTQVYEGRYIQRSPLTFDKWLYTWLYDYKMMRLKPITIDTYERLIKNQIIPNLGHIVLQDLKAVHIQKLYNELYNNGEGLSSATIRKTHSIINASLKRAVLDDFLIKNPAEDLELPELEEPKIKAFTKYEEELFLKTAKDSVYFDPFLLALDTGLRMGELLALAWTNVDLKNETVTVSSNIILVKDRNKTEETQSNYNWTVIALKK